MSTPTKTRADPARCVTCDSFIDLAAIEVLAASTEGVCFRTPCCGVLANDHPNGFHDRPFIVRLVRDEPSSRRTTGSVERRRRRKTAALHLKRAQTARRARQVQARGVAPAQAARRPGVASA